MSPSERPAPRRRLGSLAISLVVFLGTAGSATAAEPDTTPPRTYFEQLAARIGWDWVYAQFRVVPDEPDATFECKLDAADWMACVSPWQIEGLAEGPHDVAVRATDAAGNTDPSPEVQSFFVDLSGPIGQVSINAGASVTSRHQVHLSMSNSDENDTLHIRISNQPDVDGDGRLIDAWDGYEWQLKNGGYGWDLADPTYGGTGAGGTKTVYMQFFDLFERPGPVTTDSIVVEPGVTPVIVRIAATENPADVGGLVGVRATVEAADGANLRDGYFTLGGCDDGTPQHPGRGPRVTLECWTRKLPAGTHRFSASFQGSSELEDSLKSIDVTVGPSVDPSPPRISINQQGPIDDGDPTETFSIHSWEAVVFQCRLDDAAWEPCGPDWTVDRPVPGVHVVQARGRDQAGTWSVVPGVLLWRLGPPPLGGFSVDDTNIRAGFPTRFSVLSLTIDPPPFSPTAVRISSSREVDEQGRLVRAIQLDDPARTTIDWDLKDSATGGYAGDGYRYLGVQWQRPDGTWEIPWTGKILLDQTLPTLEIVLNGNAPFVAEDEVMILAKSTESDTIRVEYSTDRSRLEGDSPGGTVGDGLHWKVGDTAPGTVSTHTIYGRARDLAGNLSRIASATITIDRTSPEGRLLAPAFVVGSRVSSDGIKVVVGGTAKDTGSGVSRTSLQEAVGSMAFAAVSTATGSKVKVSRSLGTDESRAYRVRASDRVGHIGPWRLGPALRPAVRDEQTSSIVYGSGWKRVKAHPTVGSTVMRSPKEGARLDFRFTGRAVALVAPMRSSLGRAKVYLDGEYVTTVDLRSSSAKTQRVVFADRWSSSGNHRLTVKVVGTGRPFVVDAFVVLP